MARKKFHRGKRSFKRTFKKRKGKGGKRIRRITYGTRGGTRL
jgi:hypothetical protein